MKNRFKIIGITVLIIIISFSGCSDNGEALHSAGSLDTDFGTNGIVLTSIGSHCSVANAIAVQADGKIVVVGYTYLNNFDYVVVRYNSNGSLDNSFGVEGIVTTDINSSNNYNISLAFQSDGKIITAGYTISGINFNSVVVRYNYNGSLDTSFGENGIIITNILYYGAVAIQSDDKIILAGDDEYFFPKVIRYNNDGSLDTTFGVDGVATAYIDTSFSCGWAVAIQSDNKIIVLTSSKFASTRFHIVCLFNSNGTLDTSFGENGILQQYTEPFSQEHSYAISLQTDSKIIITGSSYSNNDIATYRYNSDGTLDTSFGEDGRVMTDINSNHDCGYAVAVQSDNKIIVAGHSGKDIAVVRYNP